MLILTWVRLCATQCRLLEASGMLEAPKVTLHSIHTLQLQSRITHQGCSGLEVHTVSVDNL
jgi:hypothetical protein